jgi:hypothetical protein
MFGSDLAPRCPSCRRRLVPILYGYPSAGLMKDAEKGRVALGGCVVSEDVPDLVCRGCRRYFKGDGEPCSGGVDPLDFRTQ